MKKSVNQLLWLIVPDHFLIIAFFIVCVVIDCVKHFLKCALKFPGGCIRMNSYLYMYNLHVVL